MNILHVRNVANIGAILATAQRHIGEDALCLQIIKRPQSFVADKNLDLPIKYPIYHLPRRLASISRALRSLSELNDFDMYHLHDGGLFPGNIDIPLIFKKKGAVCIHWHGTKLRKREKGLSKYAALEFVSTPDLLKYVEDAEWIPNPIDLDNTFLEPVIADDDPQTIKILHAPTNRIAKGTASIISAVGSLKTDGYDIDLNIVENRPHRELVQEMKNSDIVIDQINPAIGTYGMVSVEAMALGKPVVCHLKEEYIALFANCPIVNSGADKLKERISYLIDDMDARRKLGGQGRRYVEKNHGADMVAKKLITCYKKIL